MATIIQIANALITELNAGTFSQTVTAARHYLPRFELKDMTALHVTVVPHGLVRKLINRGHDSVDYQIDVAVQRKTDLSEAGLDALMTLVEEIALFVRTTPLQGAPGVWCVEVANDPIYAPDHLEEFRQFTSVLTVTYRQAVSV